MSDREGRGAGPAVPLSSVWMQDCQPGAGDSSSRGSWPNCAPIAEGFASPCKRIEQRTFHPLLQGGEEFGESFIAGPPYRIASRAVRILWARGCWPDCAPVAKGFTWDPQESGALPEDMWERRGLHFSRSRECLVGVALAESAFNSLMMQCI